VQNIEELDEIEAKSNSNDIFPPTKIDCQ